LGTMKKIENSNAISKEMLSKISYYEKEYFIHGDKNYVDSINLLIPSLIVSANRNYSNSNGLSNIATLLNNYNLTFTQLAYLDEQLGLKHKEGLRIELDQLAEDIGVKFSLLVDNADIYERKLSNQLIYTYILVGFLLLAASIAISLIVSKHISNPLVYLSSHINAFVTSKFTLIEKIKVSNPKGEIGQLGNNFLILRNEIVDYLNYFKEKVDERTAELLIEKNRVENQKEEIEAQRDALNCQNQLILKQKKEVEKQRENVISSIRYASRIQNALLADEQQLKSIIPQAFLFQKPSDIVSGDFCFAERIKTTQKDYSVIILADCTGHGVPGAFMSLLCYNYLNQIIKVNQHINPIYVLATLNNMIYNNLHQKQDDKKISDGLDMSYLLINNKTLACEYTGAHNPLYLFRNNELIEFKGDKISIGGKSNIVRKITKHKFQLEPYDSIFLFTDGYADQDGGSNRDKFKYRRFRDLLLQIHKHEPTYQKTELERILMEWKGDKDQVDDITILGFQYNSLLNKYNDQDIVLFENSVHDTLQLLSN
jgi:serine phosphatase RsbU (regulator of sigma subunit)